MRKYLHIMCFFAFSRICLKMRSDECREWESEANFKQNQINDNKSDEQQLNRCNVDQDRHKIRRITYKISVKRDSTHIHKHM